MLQIQDLQSLSRKSIERSRKRIRLLATDIDGCLNLEGHQYDENALQIIRTANQLAGPENPIPFVTICSGCPGPYVDVMMRMIAGIHPAIIEYGCGLFFPDRIMAEAYRWVKIWRNGDNLATEEKISELVREIQKETGAVVEVGKEIMTTFWPPSSMSVDEVYRVIEEKVAVSGLPIRIFTNPLTVDLVPAGVDKGSGLKWLVEELASFLPEGMKNIAGIGDTLGDMPFLELCGFSGAPQNAVEEIKGRVSYVASTPGPWAVVDVLEECILRNQGNG